MTVVKGWNNNLLELLEEVDSFRKAWALRELATNAMFLCPSCCDKFPSVQQAEQAIEGTGLTAGQEVP